MALRTRGRATWRHLGTNFAPNSPTTESGLVTLSLVQQPQSLLLLSSPLSGANVYVLPGECAKPGGKADTGSSVSLSFWPLRPAPRPGSWGGNKGQRKSLARSVPLPPFREVWGVPDRQWSWPLRISGPSKGREFINVTSTAFANGLPDAPPSPLRFNKVWGEPWHEPLWKIPQIILLHKVLSL